MTFSTYERYNENEYFLKFLAIHPILQYSNDKFDIAKKTLQLSLIKKFNEEKITYDELESKYNVLVNIENKNKNVLDQLKDTHNTIEENIKNILNNNLIEICNNIHNY